MFYYFFQHKIIWTELNSIPWGEKAGCDLVLKTLHKKSISLKETLLARSSNRWTFWLTLVLWPRRCDVGHSACSIFNGFKWKIWRKILDLFSGVLQRPMSNDSFRLNLTTSRGWRTTKPLESCEMSSFFRKKILTISQSAGLFSPLRSVRPLIWSSEKLIKWQLHWLSLSFGS